MARYIDVDELKLKVRRYLIPHTDDDGTVRVEVAEQWFLKLLDEAPAADVAPKREVAREILGEIESMAINGTVWTFSKDFAELKKKYMEDEE